MERGEALGMRPPTRCRSYQLWEQSGRRTPIAMDVYGFTITAGSGSVNGKGADTARRE